MRKLSTPTLAHRLLQWRCSLPLTQRLLAHDDLHHLQQAPPRRGLAQVRPEPLGELWFTSSNPVRSPADDLLNSPQPGNGDRKPPDERTLKLGKTLRTLSPLLPNILTTPLPPEIVSPAISLHLFPSTHPHLPTVKGRVPYRAALWTAPVAWGCVPIVGSTKLQIVSEKIVRSGFVSIPQPDGSNVLSEEKLVVRWKTEKRKNGQAATDAARSTSVNDNGGINRGLSALLGGDRPLFQLSDSEFTGLFIFSFDNDGRILTHTIEHADENNGFDRTSKMVTLTDWLLGKARGRQEEEALVPGLAICREEWARDRRARGKGERLC
jgi:Mitochondrial protein up-regulated during meiosis